MAINNRNAANRNVLYIEMRRMERAVEQLNALPREVSRATRNAINATASAARKDIVKRIGSGLGIKAKAVRDRITLKRYDPPRRPYATVVASGKRLPLREFRHEIDVVDGTGTRARILVRDRLTGTMSVAYGFVNPRGQQQAQLARNTHKGAAASRRQPPVTAPGRSLRPAFADVVTGDYRRSIAADLAAEFERKLRDQISKRKS